MRAVFAAPRAPCSTESPYWKCVRSMHSASLKLGSSLKHFDSSLSCVLTHVVSPSCNLAAHTAICLYRVSWPVDHSPAAEMTSNRPIVLLGSGLETGHPDQARPCQVQLCYAEKQWSSLILSPSPVLLSLVPARIFLFLRVLGFFDWPMVVPFFSKKLCNWRAKPFEGLIVDRLAQRTVCTLTDEPRINQHCKKSLESLLIGKTELFRDENRSVMSSSTSTDVDHVHRLAAISSALLVPR